MAGVKTLWKPGFERKNHACPENENSRHGESVGTPARAVFAPEGADPFGGDLPERAAEHLLTLGLVQAGQQGIQIAFRHLVNVALAKQRAYVFLIHTWMKRRNQKFRGGRRNPSVEGSQGVEGVAAAERLGKNSTARSLKRLCSCRCA
jgi:hypothetical protein